MRGSASGCKVWVLQIAKRRTPSIQTTSSGYLYPGAGGWRAMGSQTQQQATGETDAPISYLPSVSQTPSYMCPSCFLKTPPLPHLAPTQTPQSAPYLYHHCSCSHQGGSEMLSASQRKETTDFLRSRGSGCVSDLCSVLFSLALILKIY